MACCEAMRSQLEFYCEEHTPEECPDCVILKFPDGRMGIPIRDGGCSILEIHYCPWCGKKL